MLPDAIASTEAPVTPEKDPENIPFSFLPRLEFWAASAIYVLAVLLLGADQGASEVYGQAGYSYNFHANYYWPLLVQYTVVYLAFLLLHFRVVPKLLQREQVLLNAGLVVLAFLSIGLICGTAETYSKAYLFSRMGTDDVYELAFQGGFVTSFVFLLMLGFYNLVRYYGQFLILNRQEVARSRQVAFRDSYVALLLWLMVLFLLLAVRADIQQVLLWGVLGLSAILVYCVSFYKLLPVAVSKKRPFLAYLWRVCLFLAAVTVPVVVLCMNFYEEEGSDSVPPMNIVFQLLFTVPLAWLLFQRHLKRNAELYVLQNKLGQSSANLDFLRSQINPHFLFNTLNTLYGTSLQENAERTAHGIQLLGDMMRFMLHENHQPRIPLRRELDYLRNYIELQSLRTTSSPDISIETAIEEVPEGKVIAPMLLIPFAENAFKHGISLKRRSWIKMALHLDGNKLHLDVHNSTHPRPENDPEKDKSGVGLDNVKQRLNMLYPRKHELVIRQTRDEYFVHLTLQL